MIKLLNKTLLSFSASSTNSQKKTSIVKLASSPRLCFWGKTAWIFQRRELVSFYHVKYQQFYSVFFLLFFKTCDIYHVFRGETDDIDTKTAAVKLDSTCKYLYAVQLTLKWRTHINKCIFLKCIYFYIRFFSLLKCGFRRRTVYGATNVGLIFFGLSLSLSKFVGKIYCSSDIVSWQLREWVFTRFCFV